MSSVLLLRLLFLSASTICSFSLRQRLHLLLALLYAGALVRMDHLVEKSSPRLLRSQTCLDSSVLCSCLACLKEDMWHVYRCLNGGSVRPTYSLVSPPASTSALYTMHLAWQLPSIGHLDLSRQLHFGSLSFFARNRLLLLLMIVPMFGKQL